MLCKSVRITINNNNDICVFFLFLEYSRTDFCWRYSGFPSSPRVNGYLFSTIQYTIQYSIQFVLQKINMTEFSKYTLFGVIVHIGGLSGGHYYSYVKRLEDEKWDLCDDRYVKRVDLANVLCRDAYILFYHKCKRDTEC